MDLSTTSVRPESVPSGENQGKVQNLNKGPTRQRQRLKTDGVFVFRLSGGFMDAKQPPADDTSVGKLLKSITVC